MSMARLSVSLVAAIGLVAAALAGATIWLLLTDPVQGADVVTQAVATRDVTPFVRAIGGVLFEALKSLFAYL